ncbi:MAG TPA: hypothetical protein P5523_04855 [Bacteroidales bacterium]|nr:hypothetical protein [Bacteroidales bacterium]
MGEEFKNQAEKLLHKFGGAGRLARIFKQLGIKKNRSSIHRWTYPKPKGTGGFIPASNWPHILLAARYDGIILTHEDLDPRLNFNATSIKAFPKVIREKNV